jgi:hypothetical protein
LESVFTNFN